MASRSDAYRKAGVDIEAGNRFVSNIKNMVASTFTKGVVTDIGGFGGLFKLDISQIKDPVLVSGADGVGTKLKLAFAFDKHDTIGIDLVAMNVNDILVQGARPLFFLDYLATGKLDIDMAETIVSGIVTGCKEAECALLGGETAEMPDFYPPNEYDLSGFSVGVVDNEKIIDGSTIGVGDALIGVASSGLHSNGYSLVRKLFGQSGLKAGDIFPGTEERVDDVLLKPTRIYVKAVQNILKSTPVKGMVHVTGGGFYDNIPRTLHKNIFAEIKFGSWIIPPVFTWIKMEGNLSWPEMLQIFNCGIGFVIIVDQNHSEEVMARLRAFDHQSWVIGGIREGRKDHPDQVQIDF